MNSTRRAPAPFDNHFAADVILRTSDNYDFYVHKLVLSLASPFFKQVFSLPQPSNPSPTTTHSDSLPILSITEDHATTHYLLRVCYPVADPSCVMRVHDSFKILEAAMKYELNVVTTQLRNWIGLLTSIHPLEIYAHACRLRLENEANTAANRWRNTVISKTNPARLVSGGVHSCPNSLAVVPCETGNCIMRGFQDTTLGSTWVKDMKGISAGCFYRLLRFVRTGKQTTFCEPPISPIVSTDSSIAGSSMIPPISDPGIPKLCPPDIVLRSSDSKLIHTYRILLAFAGATKLLEKPLCEVPPPCGLPTVDVDADEATICNLLSVCQPVATDMVTNKAFTPGELHRLLDVAQAYGMTNLVKILRSSWSSHFKNSSTVGYLVAMKQGWLPEAKQAAEASMKLPLFDKAGYVPEMEFFSADALYKLYEYQHNHRRASATVLEQFQHNSTTCQPTIIDADIQTTPPLVLIPVLSKRTDLCYLMSCCCSKKHLNQEKDNLVRQTDELLKKMKVASAEIRLEPLV